MSDKIVEELGLSRADATQLGESSHTCINDRRDEEALTVGARSVAESRRSGERCYDSVSSQDVGEFDGMDHRFHVCRVDLVQNIDVAQDGGQV